MSIAQHRILRFSALHQQSSFVSPENSGQAGTGNSWSTMTLPTFATSGTHTNSAAPNHRASAYSKDIHDSYHKPAMAAPSLLSSFLITVDPSTRRPLSSPDTPVHDDDLARPIESEERIKPVSGGNGQIHKPHDGSKVVISTGELNTQEQELHEDFDYRIDTMKPPAAVEEDNGLEEEEQDALEAGIATTMDALLGQSRSSRSHHHAVMDGDVGVGVHRGSTESGVPIFGASSSSSRSHQSRRMNHQGSRGLKSESSTRSFTGTFQEILQSSSRLFRNISPPTE